MQICELSNGNKQKLAKCIFLAAMFCCLFKNT